MSYPFQDNFNVSVVISLDCDRWTHLLAKELKRIVSVVSREVYLVVAFEQKDFSDLVFIAKLNSVHGTPDRVHLGPLQDLVVTDSHEPLPPYTYSSLW
jgi:hypothetical protein